jgi:hypothetical protein
LLALARATQIDICNFLKTANVQTHYLEGISPMSKPKTKNKTPKKFPILFTVIAGVVLVLLLAGGGFAFAASMEQNNSFCGSCHTQPESTNLSRSQAAQPVDMASYHIIMKGKNCIDCHAGPGLTGRMSAELQGALNAFHWFTGTAVQPAKLIQPIADGNCLQCHQDVTRDRARNNHFHGLLVKWQAADPNAGHCVSCHSGHSTTSSLPANFRADQRQDQAVCDACHRAIRRGDD